MSHYVNLRLWHVWLKAAVAGGAVGIRCQGLVDISAIKGRLMFRL